MKNRKLSVGVCTPPLASSGIPPLLNLVDLISPSVADIYLLTGGAAYDWFKDDKRVCLHKLQTSDAVHLDSHFVVNVLTFFYTQLEVTFRVAKVGKYVDSWIFFMGAGYFPLALLAAKILGKEVLILMSGNFLDPSVLASDFPKITSVLYKTSRLLSDRIILYADLVKQWNLERYRKKIMIAPRHFLDFDEFRLKNDLEQRGNVIGYVGRLSTEKGILNLVEAMPKTLTKMGDVKFLIIGTGPLEDDVRRFLDTHSLNSKVELTGWIPHSELPGRLNDLKLLVLPSYTEGLPNTMLEAMACGTPVLATSVGAVPEVIKDKETGFLLRDNSPACIAEGIAQALDYPYLEQVAAKARNLVQTKFNYENAVKSWARVLCASGAR